MILLKSCLESVEIFNTKCAYYHAYQEVYR